MRSVLSRIVPLAASAFLAVAVAVAATGCSGGTSSGTSTTPATGATTAAGTSPASSTSVGTTPAGGTSTARRPSPSLAKGQIASTDGVLVLTVPSGFTDTTEEFAKIASDSGATVVLGATSKSVSEGFSPNLVVTTVNASNGQTAASALADLRRIWESEGLDVVDVPARAIAGITCPGLRFDQVDNGRSLRQTQHLLFFEGAAYVFTLSSTSAGAASADDEFEALLDSIRLA